MTRCWPPTSTGRSTCCSTSPATTTGPRRSRTSSGPGAGSTSWSTTRGWPVVAGSTSPPSTSGAGSPTSTCSGWSAAPAPSSRCSRRSAPATSSTSPRSPDWCTRPAWRATTPSRPPSWRSPRPPATSSRRTASARAWCAPPTSAPELVDRMRGADAALGAVIGRLVETAPLGPDEIAAAVLEGLDRGDELILPDAGRARGLRLKRDDRAAYDRQMRHQAASWLQDAGMTDEAVAGPRRGRLRRRGRRGVVARARGRALARAARRDPGGPAVPRRRLQPDLPARLARHHLILRRPPTGVKAQGRPRHGPRAPDPGRAGAGLPAGARDGRATATTRR